MKISSRYRPFWTLYYREICRFYKVLIQTVFSPLVSSSLYLLIFGVSLGQKIEMGNGFSYLAFIIPGLVMMSVLNNAFQNASSSVVSGKFSGDLEDYRVAPLSVPAILWALALGGLTRGLLVGAVTFSIGQIFYFMTEGQWIGIHSAPLLVFFLIIGGLSFAMFGISVAFWAKTFDHLNGVGSFVVLPLIYLGGVFFSLENLHPIWQNLSKANPLLYFINGVRHSMMGVSDVSMPVAMVVSVLSLCVFYTVASVILKNASYSRW